MSAASGAVGTVVDYRSGRGEVPGKVLGVLLRRDAYPAVNEDGVLRATKMAVLYD